MMYWMSWPMTSCFLQRCGRSSFVPVSLAPVDPAAESSNPASMLDISLLLSSAHTSLAPEHLKDCLSAAGDRFASKSWIWPWHVWDTHVLWASTHNWKCQHSEALKRSQMTMKQNSLARRCTAVELIIRVCCSFASARVVCSRYVIALAWTDISCSHMRWTYQKTNVSCKHTCEVYTVKAPCGKQIQWAQSCFRRVEERVRAFQVSQLTLCLWPCKCVPATFCCSNAAVSLQVLFKKHCD